ncbi:hypothetical protein [Streptacidiphilus neutrinimicus]|uniref:hypothetical protein n=1 Tax=Streptacidiphilus neutrinimicus TaxID=105420 RepID=UPI0005A82B61|nr:hypothetical protein [Streptacidiphilus neutrinimicus]
MHSAPPTDTEIRQALARLATHAAEARALYDASDCTGALHAVPHAQAVASDVGLALIRVGEKQG